MRQKGLSEGRVFQSQNMSQRQKVCQSQMVSSRQRCLSEMESAWDPLLVEVHLLIWIEALKQFSIYRYPKCLRVWVEDDRP